MLKAPTLLFILFFSQFLNAQITLTHNVGNTPVETDMFSCEDDEYWAKVFNLSDFGISSNEQFIINSGQAAISKSYGGARISMAICSIEEGFPNSTIRSLGVGTGFDLPIIEDGPRIVDFNFSTPTVVPAGVKKILVIVSKSVDHYNPNSAEVYIAGTAKDNSISWYNGCNDLYTYTPTADLGVPDANFFINVTGEKFNAASTGSNTVLSYNYCDNLIDAKHYSCSWGGIKFARTFKLQDFGISNLEEFIIDKAQVGLTYAGVYDVKIQFNIYKIDNNFPNSYSEGDLIGSSQVVNLPYINSRANPRIIDVSFNTPVVVPNNVENILVEVYNLSSSASSGYIMMAGTEQSEGLSWVRAESGGCIPLKEYKSIPLDKNFYIKAIGKARNKLIPFSMNITNNCSDFNKGFSITTPQNATSITWNFGDPLTGDQNTSSEFNPTHDFSKDGEYTISATINSKDGNVYTLKEKINVLEAPYAYDINDVYACEDVYGTGISSNFDTSEIHNKIVDGRNNIVVDYFDGKGNRLPSPLPDRLTNSIAYTENIYVSVSHENKPCCYSETTFNLVANPSPNISSINDIVNCDDNNDGFATFNLTTVKNNLLTTNSNLEITFYHENNTEITNLVDVKNLIKNEELITVFIKNSNTSCNVEKTFSLIVDSAPNAHELEPLIGCDDNNDGISEYFDTTLIESSVLGEQSDLEVSYFDSNGLPLPNPLPRFYTNSIPNKETIIVRVTNLSSGCYAETPLELKTSSQPKINTPKNLYACDLGNGYATFNTSGLESQLIGNQTGLIISYYDNNNNLIPNFITSSYKNTTPYKETINVTIEDASNPVCYSDTSFNLVVNRLPEINLDSSYFLCNLQPSLNLAINPSYDIYSWYFENDKLISSTNSATIQDEGTYTINVSKLENNILCDNTFSFRLIRSTLPKIQDVKYGELGNNFIEIIAFGDGDFEYSIDGTHYQDSNYFKNISGGTYTAFVRDKDGCGFDTKTVTLIDYPKFFTPNNDGYNDFWKIKGVTNLPKLKILIFNRYGKLLKQLTPNNLEWDGTFKGKPMPTDDYWFTASFENGKDFSGHFTLKR